MNAPILPTLISTSCIVISAILVAIGWALIWKRQVHKHKTLCYGLPFRFNILYYLCSKNYFIGTAFGGPSSIKVYYTIFLVFHIILCNSWWRFRLNSNHFSLQR